MEIGVVASSFAVASLAIQLVDSLTKAHEFWSSIKDAPDDIQSLSFDLKLWSTLFAEIADEAKHYPPNDLLATALKRCKFTVDSLTAILNEIEPGFSAESRRRRSWAAFKTVVKARKVKKFQGTLERLNGTLQLVQQSQSR